MQSVGALTCAGDVRARGCWGADVVVEERRRLRSMKRGHASRTAGTATRNLRSLLIHPTLLHLLLLAIPYYLSLLLFHRVTASPTLSSYHPVIFETNQSTLVCMRAVKRSSKCDERVKRLYCEELSLRRVPLPKALGVSIISCLTD